MGLTFRLYRIKYLESGVKERVLEETKKGYTSNSKRWYPIETYDADHEIDIEVDPRQHMIGCIIMSPLRYKDTGIADAIYESIQDHFGIKKEYLNIKWKYVPFGPDKKQKFIKNYFEKKGWIDDSDLAQSTEVEEKQDKKRLDNKHNFFKRSLKSFIKLSSRN